MFAITCRGTGISSRGNKKPLNKRVGKNKPIIAANIAVCCVSAKLEMSIPTDSEVTVNNVLSNINNNILPTIGTSST